LEPSQQPALAEIEGDARLISLLGLARRAGKLHFGIDSLKGLHARHGDLMVIASPELAPRSIRELGRLAESTGVRVVLLKDFSRWMDPLGRPGVKVVAVSDAGFRAGLDGYFE
jgi:ribosomal protein L7Ae-like RNA K-turn-binding protein